MTQQIIDKINGWLIISEDFIISRQTSETSLLAHFGSQSVEIRDARNGWVQYAVKDVLIKNTLFAFTFFYENSQLKSISYIFDYSPTDSWANWSVEKEEISLAKYRNWLFEQVGSEKDFAWGSVNASFDPKGGFSHLFLRYN